MELLDYTLAPEVRAFSTPRTALSSAIETDAPYLAPTPHRGKRNEPAFIPLIVDRLADVYQTTPERIEQITSQNARSLFAL